MDVLGNDHCDHRHHVLFHDSPAEQEAKRNPEVLNQVPLDKEYFARIKEGFYQVVNGIYGTVRQVDEAENSITVEVASGVRIKFDRSAILPKSQAGQNQR